jgi:malonyl-CoA O-methyltransferase
MPPSGPELPAVPDAAAPAGGASATQAGRPVDALALARIRRRLDAAAQPPWLHAEVARRMAERLPVVRLQPQRVLDWHAHRGASGDLLRRVYPKAEVVAVEPDDARAVSRADPSTGWPRGAARWWPWRRQAAQALSDAADPAAAGTAQLLWANMALHLLPDPQRAFDAWHRWLAVDGFLMFSTLGPGSLQALRTLYAGRGWGAPHAPFVDMHDLGDMLVEAGFADPVMDQETLTLHWADADALLAELRSLGGNADPSRHPGLRGRDWRAALIQGLLDSAGGDGRPALQFEVVYGHAFRPLPRARVAPVTTLGVDELRAMARQRRDQPRGHPGTDPLPGITPGASITRGL